MEAMGLFGSYLSPGPLKKASESVLQKVSLELLSCSPKPSRTDFEDLTDRRNWRLGIRLGTSMRARPGFARVSVKRSFLQIFGELTMQSVMLDARASMLELRPWGSQRSRRRYLWQSKARARV